MDRNTDQTNFWLGWKATCAAQDCANPKRLLQACGGDLEAVGIVPADAEAVAELARDVIGALNASFRQALDYYGGLHRHRRVSEYADEARGWSAEHPERGSAFHIVEGKLYAHETSKGRPFKDYLFEDAAARGGGMGKNLFGYLKWVAWRSCAKKSFGKEDRLEERTNDEGQPMEEDEGSTADRNDLYSLQADLRTDIRLAEENLVKFFDGKKRDGDWDSDQWISLYCAFHGLPLFSPGVAALCGKRKTMLAKARDRAVGDLASALRCDAGIRDRAIRAALTTRGAAILDAAMEDMPFFPELERLLADKDGKNGGGSENARPGDL